jgi:hypothetical protein
MATYTNLDNEILAQSALQGFVAELAPFNAFSTNFSPEPVAKGKDVLVPLIGALTATTFGGSYAICGGTKTVITVSINRHKHVPIGQNDLDAANSSASSLEDFGYQQGAALAIAVLQDVFSLVTTGYFGLATAVASTALDVPQLRKARLILNTQNAPRSPRAMLLDCVPFDALLGVTNFIQAYMFKDQGVLQEGRIIRALGFDFFELNGLFTQPSVMGFAAHASAIAIAMRYLMPQKGNSYSDARAVTDPKTGLTFGLRDHFDNNTGTRYVNLEANYGYSVGITMGGSIFKRTD